MKNWGTSPELPDILETRGRVISYQEAICEAMETSLEENSAVRVLGEGVTDPAGIYGTTKNLHLKFGKKRVFDVPLAEGLITGIGTGMALVGLKPIVIHPRNDFLLLTMDQLCNQAAKWSFMFGGKIKVPLVVRTIGCRGWGSAAQHAQALHSILAHFPGLKILLPFSPSDAKGFILWAVFKSESPVIIMEHKWLYRLRGDVPIGRYIAYPGKPNIIRKGKDITIVGISYGLFEALQASSELADAGIEAEVIDTRSLRPLDFSTIFQSVEKTGRVLVVDTGHLLFGSSGEIITKVIEKVSLSNLKSPPARIGIPDSPTPAFSESSFYPSSKNIVSIVKKMVKCK